MSHAVEERPLFFSNGRHSLFGVLHKPAVVESPRPAFVFCHPLGEEKLWAHRVFVSYARQLAAAGHHVLRFDLTGNGDSEGAFSDLSMAVACHDTRCAIQELRRRTGATDISLLGLRLGANVAMMVAEETEPVRHLILWAPITDGDRYAQDLLRINVMTQMATFKVVRQERPALVAEMEQGRTVNVDGYEMAWPLYASIAALKPASEQHSFSGPCLVVQIDRQPRPAPDLQQLTESYRSATLAFAQEDAFWKEISRFYQEAPNLFTVTNAWLGKLPG
jgi:exosortase A-associated hydrolase 2